MIKAIYIAAEFGGDQLAQEQIEVRAGLGIVGDRNFGKHNWPGQNITFIEQEEIDRYNSDLSQCIQIDAPRRNLVTKGVRLNDLVGKRFVVGDVEFEGIELCEPCKNLGELLANNSISAVSVIKSLLHKGGLRANVMTDGFVSVGMSLGFKA